MNSPNFKGRDANAQLPQKPETLIASAEHAATLANSVFVPMKDVIRILNQRV